MTTKELLQSEAKQECECDADCTKFKEYLKQCFKTTNYAPVRVNFCGRGLYNCERWIDAPTCMKQPIINFLSRECFKFEMFTQNDTLDYIIVKLF